MDFQGIIPEIIDAKPKSKAEITYPSGVKVTLGGELTPTQVKDQPTVTWASEDNALYSLSLVCPDCPSRAEPTDGEALHWLVINIPGSKVADGQTVAEYVGAIPQQGKGLHRFVFLVYKQAGKIETTKTISKTTREGRLKVKTRDYVAKHNLGAPIAGNCFEAQYDDYVPILLKQLQ